MEVIQVLQALLRAAADDDGADITGVAGRGVAAASLGLSDGELEHVEVLDMQPLSGGSINNVYRVELSTGASVVLKYHSDPPARFFATEADGLSALRHAQAIRVPEVFAVHEKGILIEWLPDALGTEAYSQRTSQFDSGERSADPGAELGEGLAKQHQVVWERYGYPIDNFVGLLPQVNTATEGWIGFFRDYRLHPQLQLAERLGRLNTKRRRLSERLLGRLSEWIDEAAVRPALLHGDLWAGNWLNTPDGPCVIDPAVYFGDREMDLAMASLFGGFPKTFFASYAQSYPLAPGHDERRPLYQLYYLLIHLNLFGESYGPQVDRILARYGG